MMFDLANCRRVLRAIGLDVFVCLAVVVALLAACDADDAVVAPTVESAEPSYAPLGGGTEVMLRGTGFVAPNRVYIGGREAPLVRTIDTTQLGVVVPAGDVPGDVEIVVLNRNGNAIERGILRYSVPPEISSVSPTRVVYTSDTTRIELTGSGFLDEGAGAVDVLVDGLPANGVAVTSDTELTFTAPPGRALVWPEITVIDARGTATTSRGFRYAPSAHDGLLLFPAFGESFAVFVDPVAMEVIPIPWAGPQSVRFTAVIRDNAGDYWGVDRSQRFGRIDMKTQTFEDPITIDTLLPTVARVGDEYIGIDRISLRIGRLDLATGTFTPLSMTTPTVPYRGSYGLAPLGGTVYFTARDVNAGTITINTVDPATGELGTPLTLTGPPGLHVEEMRTFGGVLYATSRDGSLVTIDPATGTATALPIAPGRASAMEAFE